ncbi:hypothetical protein C4573_06580 [Candidatus Woesearchaeota archaeon]|nr:MAG: hypothetical protein C4573_06580 [Candidatus Woesearchaeota archaeon]
MADIPIPRPIEQKKGFFGLFKKEKKQEVNVAPPPEPQEPIEILDREIGHVEDIDMSDLDKIGQEIEKESHASKKIEEEDEVLSKELDKELHELPDFALDETAKEEPQSNEKPSKEEKERREAERKQEKEQARKEEEERKKEERERTKKEAEEKREEEKRLKEEEKQRREEQKKEEKQEPILQEKHTEHAPEHHEWVKIPSNAKMIQPKKGIKKYFDDLDHEHKKLSQEIKNIVTKPEQKTEKIQPEHFFYLKNGRPLKSLHDLIDALKTIDDESFRHHVNEHKNDFANWLKDILKHEKLADEIRNKKAKAELLKILEDYEHRIDKSMTQEKKEMLAAKKEQLKLLQRVKFARQELYTIEADLDKQKESIVERENRLSKKQDAWNDKYQKESTSLAKQKEEFARQKSSITGLQKKLQNQLKDIEKEKTRLAKQKKTQDGVGKLLQEKLHDLEIKTKSVQAQESAVRAKQTLLEKQEIKVKSNLDEEEKLRKTLDDVRQKIQQEKDMLEKQGFKKYVEEELERPMQEHLTEVSNINGALDIPETAYPEVYKKITDCKRLVNQGRLGEAQEMYNQLKTEYYNKKIASKEKEKIYNKIREVYDAIHLALMNAA